MIPEELRAGGFITLSADRKALKRLHAVRLLRAISSRAPQIRGLGWLMTRVALRFRGLKVPDSTYRVDTFSLVLNPSDRLGNSLIFFPQYWERRERHLIKKLLGDGDYVVDGGANIGQYALFLSELVGPRGEVIAIEAERENFLRLTENVNLNNAKNVSLKNFGISNGVHSMNLLLNSTGNNGGHSFFEQSDSAEPPTQRVDCLPLSMLLTQCQRPKFMKLDIEGFEFRVLKEFLSKVERRWWPLYLMIEDNELRREGDAVALCLEHGYREFERFGENVFLVHSSGEGAASD